MGAEEQIAEILLGHKSAIRGCECGYEEDIDYYEHLAAVLVAELVLTKEIPTFHDTRKMMP